ncbi:histidine phosphatase family protein [Rhodococcus triatomae]|uniref:Phosphohistidine phosphatase n=1 Tax=Rhodococcus triatomae TaxID=300028 RepID=A0A1G8JEP3_9NOCA|nr:histidine phosphatase family protein [Rhodococcus triatomae]QNG19736.1 histidine phosphatase family protein [Rhodococcus triatomae]QNG24348.1 histidine phosphatase family protein [Rhodococcus triatomae]SDI29666.1 phosphohistidine phosphatase [Rhodococcus triatomae]
MTNSRTLVLLRHGKSAYPEGTPDHERPLAERGLRQAGLAGDWIRTHLPPIDAVLCSSARRTRETLSATGLTAPTSFRDELYGAGPEEILAQIAHTAPEVSTLLVVGHEPGMPATALTLAGNIDSPAADGIRSRFPTSALAVLSVPGDWRDIAPSGSTLVTFHIPR